MIRRVLIFCFILVSINVFAQKNRSPKVVVGIVVDQMKAEYLTKYSKKFGEGGFKRLLKEGFLNKNMHYNYVPTETGPGHASIFSGTTPKNHGIVANVWYDRETKNTVYCVQDTTVKTIGSTSRSGEMSPKNLIASNFADQLKLASQKKSKVIGVSLKDRGAILPAGHLPDGAFWYDSYTGNFISSSYYFSSLPEWVERFNARGLAKQYLDSTWKTLFPIDQYTESGPDDIAYEHVFKGKDKSTFPYNLKVLKEANGMYKLLRSTPYGNALVLEMAKAALEGEDLGKDEFVDFMSVSFSSTDVIGHGFGPQSIELEDCYLRLDRQIANLLSYLDKKVGKGEYLVFLTADHGAIDVPHWLIDNRVPAGYFKFDAMEKQLIAYLKEKFGEGNWVDYVGNNQVYLNHDLIRKRKLDLYNLQQVVADYVLSFKGIAGAQTGYDIRRFAFDDEIEGRLYKGFNVKRSGDVLIILEPGWIADISYATTHGSGYSYDTHVPLIWFGWNIKAGSSAKHQDITDIVATLCMMLDVPLPNAATGQPISEICK